MEPTEDLVKRLWAPWRTSYITQANKPAGCFLCMAAEPGQRTADVDEDRDRLVVARTPLSVIVLNRYPYNNGHLLVCPRAHLATLDELPSEVSADLQAGLATMVQVLREVMNADGFNIGLNLGKAAGAGVPGHLHWHIVPRWNGDHNFMAVTGDAKVISQSLDAAWQLLSHRAAGRFC